MISSRAATIAALRERVLDVLVIGGGIIGAGISRDLALRGCSVGLVERTDLAAGTSSRPTRLVHGGLRYLELLDFGLVREDLRERERLLRNAPHLVRPLPLLIPMDRSSLVYRWKLWLGMWLYDLFSFDKSLPRRRWVPREELIATEPNLRADSLTGAWRFFDAQAPYVERLVVENALDAAAHGALVLTHASTTRFLRRNGRVEGVSATDALTREDLEIRARFVVNATGPWVDDLAGQLRPSRSPLLRRTKGVHLVTERGTEHAYVLFARSNGRLFFVIPWAGMELIGTTDTDYDGDAADAAASETDVRYLRDEAKRVFPTAPFERIHYTYAGVRALAREEGVVEGDVSRRHAVHDHETSDGVAGVVSVVGGKLTGYRAIAEEVGDLVMRKLRRRRSSITSRRPLPGGGESDIGRYLENVVRPRAEVLGVSRGAAEWLANVYGSLATDVLDLVAADGSLAEELCPHQPIIAATVTRAVRDEWAVTLGDVLLRRTLVGLGRCRGLDCVERVAERAGALLGWDDPERDRQVDAYRAELAPGRPHSAS